MGENTMATQPALATLTPMPPAAMPRPDLPLLRASGLAQARLQLAVLSGNRRRALEQIERLIGIDRLLERVGRGEPPPAGLEDDLAAQRLAIASEKLALASQVSLPRLEPAFGAGMGAALDPCEEVEIVEDKVLAGRLSRVLLWASGLLVLSLGVGAAAVLQL
jgi:hypothetical protein